MVNSWARAFFAATVITAAASGTATAAPGTGSADASGSSQAAATPDQGTSAIDCAPSAARPNPVLVLHGLGGTAANVASQLTRLTATLRTAGYCTLQLMYGNAKGTQGAGPVSTSARQLAAYVDAVKSKTGASKVNIVAHSTGGLVANYYAKVLKGAGNLNKVVGLAPVTHGTDAAAMGAQLGSSGIPGGPAGVMRVLPFLRPLAGIALSQGYVDVLAWSNAVCAVENGGVAQPGVRYAVLATKNDTVITPAGVASFIQEPGVVNAFYEDLFPSGAKVSHPTLPMAPDAIKWAVQQLG